MSYPDLNVYVAIVAPTCDRCTRPVLPDDFLDAECLCGADIPWPDDVPYPIVRAM